MVWVESLRGFGENERWKGKEVEIRSDDFSRGRGSRTDRSARLEQQNRHLPQIEVDKVLCLVGHVAEIFKNFRLKKNIFLSM